MKISRWSQATGEIRGQAELLLPFKSHQEGQPLLLLDLEPWLSNPFKAATVLVESTLEGLSWQNLSARPVRKITIALVDIFSKGCLSHFPLDTLTPLFLVISEINSWKHTTLVCVSLTHSSEKNLPSSKNQIGLPQDYNCDQAPPASVVAQGWRRDTLPQPHEQLDSGCVHKALHIARLPS